MLQGEHSAILLTFIKLPFVVKIFIFCLFKVAAKDMFYCIDYLHILPVLHCLGMCDTKGSTCLLWDITTEKSGLCCYAVRITQNTYVKK